MECLLPHLSMVTVPHTMVGLERMLDYRGFTVHTHACILHCTCFYMHCTYDRTKHTDNVHTVRM